MISDVTLQIRYRWQIAPLSDLFIVYNRGGGLPGGSVDSSFGSLFGDTFSEPQGEALIVKLRYSPKQGRQNTFGKLAVYRSSFSLPDGAHGSVRRLCPIWLVSIVGS